MAHVPRPMRDAFKLVPEMFANSIESSSAYSPPAGRPTAGLDSREGWRLFADIPGTGCAYKFPATLGVSREARAIPSSTEGLDQLSGGDHSPAENVYRSNLVRESRALRDRHFQVTGNTAVVSCDGEFQGFLGRNDCFILSLGFFLQNAQSGEIVFHLLETSKHRFAIRSHGLVVDRNGLV